MANDCIPRPDARFHAWENNFAAYLNGHLADPKPHPRHRNRGFRYLGRVR